VARVLVLARGYASGFESWLLAQGYSPSTVSHRLWQLDLLSHWLERKGPSAGELTGGLAERFVRARRAAGYATWVSPVSLRLPLGCLREIGAVPSPVPAVAVGPVEELLAAYRGHLVFDRGLAEMTVYHCEGAARVFLEDRSEQTSGVLALERLTAGDVTGFLARECLRRAVAMARDLVTRLRNFVRYLHLTGVIEVAWLWAVPGVADQRDPTLPRGLAPAVVAKLLASCDRGGTVGRRDHAILLLLVRLGLRSGEVAAIQLGTSIGAAGRSWYAGSATVTSDCRCRSTSARRWRATAIPHPPPRGQQRERASAHGSRPKHRPALSDTPPRLMNTR
jgi:integrase/recombinase XerD